MYIKLRGSERATNGEPFEEDAKELCVQEEEKRTEFLEQMINCDNIKTKLYIHSD
jgi:pantothenate kinase